MPQLAIYLLGSPHIEYDGTAITLDRRKALALVAYLAVNKQTHRRDRLAVLLWPEYDQTNARAALRRVLATLNATPLNAWLVVDRETIGLQHNDDVWVDVVQFEHLLEKGHLHNETEVSIDDIASLSEAVTLYHDDFMLGFTLRDSSEFDEWQFVKAEDLRRDLGNTLSRLVQGYRLSHEIQSAITAGRRWAALDMLNEEAHRQLMLTYAWAGQFADALRQYDTCVQILSEELDIVPHDATTHLYDEIKAGRIPMMDSDFHHTKRSTEVDRATLPYSPLRLSSVEVTSPPLLQSPSSPLPHPPTPLLGRETELATIARHLADPACYLITITGSGGMGKTRLAMQIARTHQSDFVDGVYFISLSGLQLSSCLASVIADALGISFADQTNITDHLLDLLSTKSMLIVLDNFEHLMREAHSIAKIIDQAPQIKLLVTSRERLHLRGEWVIELMGLPLPAHDSHTAFESSSAAQLFVQSASRMVAHFTPTLSDQMAIMRICRLLEGMPLGIELAAGWVRLLSCEEIANELEQSLDFLATSLRDVPERHQSLRAVFNHSWHLLSEEEQLAFQRLAIFEDGFMRDAGEQIAGASLAVLGMLSDKSLLRRTGTGRYELHDLVKQFALEHLQSNEAEYGGIGEHHCRYYLKRLVQEMENLNDIASARVSLDSETANIRTAWSWALTNRYADLIVQVSDSLRTFYKMKGYAQDAVQAFGQAIDVFDQPDNEHTPHTVLLAKLLMHQGTFYHTMGRYALAKRLFQRALVLARTAGDRYEIAAVMGKLGFLATDLGEYAEARQLLESSLRKYQHLNDQSEAAHIQEILGYLYGEMGMYQEAIQLLNQSIAFRVSCGCEDSAANSYNSLGYVYELQGDYETAHSYLQKALAAGQADHWPKRRLAVFSNLGFVYLALQREEQARQMFNDVLSTAMQYAAKPIALLAVVGLSTLLSRSGQQERAVELLTMVVQHPFSNREALDRAQKLLTDIEATLLDETFAAAQSRGYKQKLKQATHTLLAHDRDTSHASQPSIDSAA